MFNSWKKDIPSSFVVFFVALPLCLGIALASGAPLFSGLIAGVVGGLVVAIISNSPLGVSGPAAGLAVIVLTAIQTLGSFEAFLTAVVLAGGIQILLGIVRAGVIGYYFPSSVIKGMLAAIGIIIILKQIPHALGVDTDYEGDTSFFQMDGENTFSELFKMMDFLSPGAMLLSAISLFLILFWDKVLSKKHFIFKTIPGALLAVVAGIFYESFVAPGSSMAIAAEHLVSVPVANGFNEFIGLFTMPDFSVIKDPKVWTVALTLAVVASLETLLSVEAIDKLDPRKRVTDTNRELFGQGAGNIVSGMIGGLPITQVIVRSSANVQSGGQTKLSAILHGVLLLISVILIPKVLNLIPLSVLACVLLLVGYKLARPKLFTEMYKAGWSQFAPFIVTVLGVVFTDLLKGIIMGMFVGVIIILRNSYKNPHFLHIEKEQNGGQVVRMTMAEEVTFLNKGAVLNSLNQVAPGSHLIVDMSKSFKIDLDVLEILEDFKTTAIDKKIKLELIPQIKR